MDILTLALVQMASTPSWTANMEAAERMLQACKGCDVVVFPENVFCLGNSSTLRATARSIEDLSLELGPFAERHGMYIFFGGVPVVRDAGGIRNAALAYSPNGRLIARYDKVHLFQLDPDRPGGIDETLVYSPGDGPVVWELGGWRICLSICYDIRFPELFRACVPVDLILCPMAFTAKTGTAHAHLLLRTRAVENQCYVASASQCGVNVQTGLQLFGHSMLVDPWGTVLADAGPNEEGSIRVRCQKSVLQNVRSTLPALRNMRPVHFDTCR